MTSEDYFANPTFWADDAVVGLATLASTLLIGDQPMRPAPIAPPTNPRPTIVGGKALVEMSDDELFVSLRSRTRHLNSMREVARHGLQEIVLLISLHNYSIRRVVARYGVTGSVGDALYEAIIGEVTCFTLHKVCQGIV